MLRLRGNSRDLISREKADAAGKILSYMCHGPIPVAAADLVQGKKITGWLACKDAVTSMGGEINAGWAVVLDGNRVSLAELLLSCLSL